MKKLMRMLCLALTTLCTVTPPSQSMDLETEIEDKSVKDIPFQVYESSHIPGRLNCPIYCKTIKDKTDHKNIIVIDVHSTLNKGLWYFYQSLAAPCTNTPFLLKVDDIFSILLILGDIKVNDDIGASFRNYSDFDILRVFVDKNSDNIEERERQIWEQVANTLKNKSIKQISFVSSSHKLVIMDKKSPQFYCNTTPNDFFSDIVLLFADKGISFYDSVGLISKDRGKSYIIF